MNIARRRRKSQPFNPAHDRQATDLLRNAQVAADEVDDPFEKGARILVLRSTRDDPLAEMKARGFIDTCDYEAGRHWQRAYEDCEIGSVRAIDPSKEAVDGGRGPELLPDRRWEASDEIAKARGELGHAGNWIVVQVLGTRMTLLQVATGRAGRPDCEAEYKYVRRRFRECLGTLAILFGYAMKAR